MKKGITALFLDIGGVLLTNGWDHLARKRAATNFKLDGFVDFFVSSCFVHLRKLDADIFRLALDLAQVPTEQILYIENTLMFVEVAQSLGIHGIHHQGLETTRSALETLGLK